MAGYASLHFRTRDKDWRLPVLVLCYLSSMLILPAIAIVVLGLSDTRRTIALTPAKPADGSDEPPTN
jgi:hypothetical protein